MEVLTEKQVECLSRFITHGGQAIICCGDYQKSLQIYNQLVDKLKPYLEKRFPNKWDSDNCRLQCVDFTLWTIKFDKFPVDLRINNVIFDNNSNKDMIKQITYDNGISYNVDTDELDWSRFIIGG